MKAVPRVSVVTSVYNGAPMLRASIESILSQSAGDFEFIIVNDGSTDESPAILDECAKADSRIRVIHQINRGLTRALITGCSQATGTHIARHDADDLSLPGRIEKELAVLDSHADVALVSCGSRFVGPRRELLYERLRDGDASDGLLTLDVSKVSGPAGHGSTLFRRDLYEHVGGYREQFYFAQDLDLRVRLAEHGRHVAIPDVLYEVSVALSSISSLQRGRQIECARLILESARLRRSGLDDTAVLASAASIRPVRSGNATKDRADALYFVGACLRERADPRAREYFRDAWRANPLHWKSAVRLLIG
jgi:glycosyltransferase involved in cell wall biosynthesis